MRPALNALAMGAIVCASVAGGAWLGNGRGDMVNPPMLFGSSPSDRDTREDGIQRSVDIEGRIVVFEGYRQVDGKTVAVFRRVPAQADPAEQEFVLDMAEALTRLGHLRRNGIAHEQTLRAVQEWPE